MSTKRPGIQPFSTADLFSGAGGLSEGFRQAGSRIVVGSDIDPDALATYTLNFPEAAVVLGDLRSRTHKRRLLEAASGAHVVVGGPPCQAFSQMRNHTRLIEDPRNSLYREFVRVVAKIRPLAFVMENVPGLEQMGVKAQVVEDLSLDGEYRVGAQLLDAADFGVPQTRKRIVFLGIHHSLKADPPTITGSGVSSTLFLTRRNGDSSPRYELSSQLTLETSSALDQLLDPYDLSVVTAEQAISDLEGLETNTARADTRPAHELPEPSSAYQKTMREGLGEIIANVGVPRMNSDTVLRLKAIPEGGNYRDLPERFRKRYLTGQLWGPHNGSGELGRRHYYAYRRLHRQLWSWTINTKADSVYHYSRPRALSVREFARLQSFPDRFQFVTDPRKGNLTGRIDGGAGHSRYRQVGNAVPPLLARAIAEALAPILSPHLRNSR